MDTAVRLSRDGRSNNVNDTNVQSTSLHAVSHSEDGIGGLSRLRDKDTGVISEDGGLAIQKVGCEFDGTGDLGQFLKDRSCLKEQS